MTSIINEINFNIIYKREGVAPGGLALLLMAMSFGGHFGQLVPIAAHRLIGQFVPYWQMHGNWHGLAEKAAKTDLSWRVCCAMVRAAVACFAVVFWLLYNTQDVEYTAPTTPKPLPRMQIFSPLEMGMK